ncbi:MAG: C13 family peptidase [Syntrophaceae bacterium]
MGQRYAVLISSSHSPFCPEFFFDVVNMRQSLLDHGFLAGNIWLLYGSGSDYSSSSYPAVKYRPSPAITNLAATITNIQQIFTDLSQGTNGYPLLTDQDLLLVYTFDHGGDRDSANNAISVLCLNDGNMRADDFATAVNQVNYAYRIFWMQQCFSGGFVTHLANDRTVILTAASSTETAKPTDTEKESIADPTLGNVSYPHGEFNWHLLATLDGQTLSGTAVNADADGNSFLTMHEIFNYITTNDSRAETPQYDDGTRRLGDKLHLSFADLYMRDNLSDNGVEPTPGGGLSTSPDINHYRNQLLDPTTTLLSPSAIDRDDLFEDIEIGQSNWIYVRVRNRGYSATDANVDIYWTPSSALPTPSTWNYLGTINVPSVGPDSWTVGGPLEWASGDIPPENHYCFVALLTNAQDPSPDRSSVTDWNSFYDLIRGNNNVVWKNFDVHNMFAGSYATFDFQIQGWPKLETIGDLEIDLSSLPAGVEAELKLLKRLVKNADLEHMTLDQQSATYARFKMDCGMVCAIRKMSLKSSDISKATLTLKLPDSISDGFYDLWARQLVGGLEMGRITRRLAVGEFPYVGNRKSKELHLRGQCQWEKTMSNRNRVAFADVNHAISQAYNGCATCMPEIDTD